MDIKDFGLYLANVREKSGFSSQRQLAIESGVSNGTIARIESGTQKATPETLKKIAACLKDVSYEDLMRASGYINIDSEEKDSDNQVDEDIKKLMEDPDFMVAYKEMPGTPEEAKEDLIGFMKLLKERHERKNKK